MEGLTEGRIVHYVLPDGGHRPAIVVRVFRTNDAAQLNGMSNLQVFLDGDNDRKWVNPNDPDPMVLWATSRFYDPNHAPGTWHWIEKA